MPELDELKAKITTESDTKGVEDAEAKLGAFGAKAEKVKALAVGAFIAIGAAASAAMFASVKSAVEFEDKMADVAKTTGITGENLAKLGDDLLDLSKSTRTSADELLTIAEIGGQLGIAEKDIMSFTKQVDIFNVALGKDFSGGVEEAATSVGKLTSLFQETKDLDVADAINRAGSAINTLGAVGAGTTSNITEFATRLGQLPEALRPSIQDSLALGTFFEEAGLSAQIASGGMTNFFLVAGKEIGGFATMMGMTTEKAKELLAADPTEFAVKFSKSLEGLDAVETAQVLDTLKIGTQETIKVVGALGGNTERFRELQKTSNDEFARGTSLLTEFNTKNNTAAAQMDKFKNTMFAIGVTVGNALLPALNKIMDAVLPIIDGFATFASEHPNVVAAILAIVAGAGILATILTGITALMTALGITTSIAILPIIGVFLLVGAAIAALYFAWQNNFLGIRDIVNSFFEWFKSNIIDPWIQTFKIVEIALLVLYNAFNFIFQLIKALLIIFLDWFANTAVGKALIGAFNVISDALGGLKKGWDDFWEGAKSTVGGAIDWVGKKIQEGMQMVKDFLNGIIYSANKVGGSIPGYVEIPMLAEGTRNFRGGPAIVGERGPELVNLPRGADVYSNDELGKAGGMTINQTNNIYSDTDTAFALRDLAYQLRSA